MNLITDEGCAAENIGAKIGQNKEKGMKNSHLFETLLTKFRPIWAWPLKGWPEKAVKYVENTRRYSVSPVFFSCFTAFSEPTQLHSIIEFKP
ncbi:MAG: hypothetical protein IH995_02810 [Proteobacteria bacterium]|nr:hypothetical protein [Pseudomonadota bacterium]